MHPITVEVPTKDWLSERNVNILEWSARSPDLNIIENVWGWWHAVFTTIRYSLRTYMAFEYGPILAFYWAEYIKRLYDSISTRLLEVIDEKGKNIPY